MANWRTSSLNGGLVEPISGHGVRGCMHAAAGRGAAVRIARWRASRGIARGSTSQLVAALMFRERGLLAFAGTVRAEVRESAGRRVEVTHPPPVEFLASANGLARLCVCGGGRCERHAVRGCERHAVRGRRAGGDGVVGGNGLGGLDAQGVRERVPGVEIRDGFEQTGEGLDVMGTWLGRHVCCINVGRCEPAEQQGAVQVRHGMRGEHVATSADASQRSSRVRCRSVTACAGSTWRTKRGSTTL